MALIQRYTTELSAHAGTIYQDKQSIENVLHNVEEIKKNDEDEKRYLHSLNDRLEDLLNNLNQLEITNKKLRNDLNFLITTWGIDGENRTQFLKELDQLINHLTEQNHRKSLFQAESKIYDEQTQIIDRIAVIFIDVINLYRDKTHILSDLINELDEELRKIHLRLDISSNQVKSHDENYQKELTKFRSYLTEWSQLALDKQYLLNDIQSLKERYNLRIAYNQEEINEWQRLLNRISQESKNYYQDYLDTIKQQIQIDYEQMANDQQNNIEIQLKTKLKEIQEKINLGLPIDEDDERRRKEETQRFENRLDQSTKEYNNLQNDYRLIAEEIQHKQRLLKDLENELKNKKRKHFEQHSRLEYNTDLTRNEYYTLKNELDKLAYQLRFSVEEELKIYEALLNSFQRKQEERLPIDDSKYRQKTTTTRYLDTISSGGESTGFPPSRTFITQTNIDDKFNYRPSSLLTQTTTKTNIDDKFKYQPLSSLTQTTTTKTNIDDKFKYQPSSLLTQPTTKTTIDDKFKYQLSSLLTQPTVKTTIDDKFKYQPSSLLAQTTTTTTKTIKQQNDNTVPIVRIEPPEKVNNQWTYETTTSSTHDDNTDRDRSAERTVLPIKSNLDGYGGIQQSLIDQNRTTTKTTRTTRRFGHGSTGQQQQQQQTAITSSMPELDEKFLQSKIHITRKYKGNILIKFVDVNGRFVEIENTGNQPRDLTGWYIERTIDGQRIDYTFPAYELPAHKTVRIYGNYHRRSSANLDDQQLQLIAPNFYDWGNGKQMRTELFNRDDVGKALFEQTIRD